MTLCPELRRLSARHARWASELARGGAADASSRPARLLALWEGEVLPHLRAEEDVLLPALAARRSDADAAVVFARGDHGALRRLARELRRAREADAAAAFSRALADYAAFEARTLFPVLQEALGCAALAALGAELAADDLAAPRRRAERAGSRATSKEGRAGRGRRRGATGPAS